MKSRYIFICVLQLLMLSACSGPSEQGSMSSCGYARYFDVIGDGSAVVTVSPYDGHRDTLAFDEPMDNIICMSSSHVAALTAIGADSLISGVSGKGYMTNPSVRNGRIRDIGYDSFIDYEMILDLEPDLLVTYTISGSDPGYVTKLKSLGIPVLSVHDHLENHPLARAEYVKLFGALVGRSDEADSVFNTVKERYMALCRTVSGCPARKRLLLNIPYGDAWYIPGGDSYMSQIIRDAGGEVLGAVKGTSQSKVISMEQAYTLSHDADIWLNPGHCRTLDELRSAHHLFPSFGPLAKGLPIYNNTLRTTPEGGNDFWETGAMRPDLVLEDLIRILQSNASDSLNFYVRISP